MFGGRGLVYSLGSVVQWNDHTIYKEGFTSLWLDTIMSRNHSVVISSAATNALFMLRRPVEHIHEGLFMFGRAQGSSTYSKRTPVPLRLFTFVR